MSAFDQYLSVDTRKGILNQRITQYATEGYQHELNLATAQTANDTEGVATSQNAIAVITSAIDSASAQLVALDAAVVDPTTAATVPVITSVQ